MEKNTQLPVGPWINEPDEKTWIDSKTGLTCTIRRVVTLGHLCGYVKVPILNLLFWRYLKKGKYDYPNLSCHGGVTWFGPLMYWAIGKFTLRKFWDICVGFDCAHCDDLSPYMKNIGFDRIGTVYRDFAYVTKECENLAEQVEMYNFFR